MRLIDADKLKQHISWWRREERELIYTVVDLQPTVDAVPVVRCRECKWFAEGKWCRNPNNDMVQGGTTGEWFCGDGKRKDGADE